MPRERQIQIHTLLLSFFLVNLTFCENWRWESKINLSLVHDNNVIESPENPKNDYAGRLFAEFSGRGRLIHSLGISVRFKGGFEGYSRYSDENRTVSDIEAVSDIPIRRSFLVGIRFQERDKIFSRGLRGYRFFQVSPFSSYPLFFGWRCVLSYSVASLDYAAGSEFDAKHRSAGVLLEWNTGLKIVWNIGWSSGSIDYTKNAFDYRAVTYLTYQWFDLEHHQEDRFQELSTQLEIYYWALLRIGYAYQKNSSNSYGYSYSRPKCTLWVIKDLPLGFTTSLYWTLLLKRYDDSLQPILQIRPDTENEENNYALIDLSKDITEHNSLHLQFGWYRNESPFRSLYYEKNLFTLGFIHRF